MRKVSARTARLLVALAIVLPCATVQAGGLFLFDRGARPLSRGGAFVAGADDPSSLWYNPAGLKDSKNQVLTDATLTLMFASVERVSVVDGEVVGRYPKVDAKPTPLPIPTLALSHNFGLDDLTFGVGIIAPNTTLLNWPKSVKTDNGNEPSPTRYSLKGLKGSILSNLALGLAYHGIDGLSIGADVQFVAGVFRVEQSLSSCDRVLCEFPEAPDYDANAVATLFPAFGITGVFGITYDLGLMRLGASAMLPYRLEGEAKLDVNVPQAPIFRNAVIVGNKADIGLDFPTIVRVGSELRLAKVIRMEGSFVWEQWSRQREITITPKNMQIQNVIGIDDYDIGPVSLPRKMRNTWSLRGGYEFFVPLRYSPFGTKFVMRGGLAYEKGAFASSAMTPLTLDSDKWVLSGGLGINLHKRVRFDTVAGYVFMKNMKVRDSEIEQPQAIRPTSNGFGTKLGNADYKMDALILGGGFAVDID
jgi:long-chain fatty acid transport protein